MTNHQIDLLILDLEFTNSNISSITYVDDFPYDIPIIILLPVFDELLKWRFLMGSNIMICLSASSKNSKP